MGEIGLVFGYCFLLILGDFYEVIFDKFSVVIFLDLCVCRRVSRTFTLKIPSKNVKYAPYFPYLMYYNYILLYTNYKIQPKV